MKSTREPPDKKDMVRRDICLLWFVSLLESLFTPRKNDEINVILSMPAVIKRTTSLISPEGRMAYVRYMGLTLLAYLFYSYISILL